MNSKNVLVIEDDPALCRLISSILKSINCKVVVAHTLSEARNYLEWQGFDLILSDIHVGVESAISLIETCQSKQQRIVAISSDDGFRSRLEELGIDFIVKPISLDQVLALGKRVELAS